MNNIFSKMGLKPVVTKPKDKPDTIQIHVDGKLVVTYKTKKGGGK
jgi:hypothetical protein